MKVLSIEGIDGTGKTELLKGLQDKLARDDRCFVRFPTERFYKKHAELDKSKYSEDDYFQAINQLQTEDKEYFYAYWKERNKKMMICDRFDVSQKVYDGSSLGEKTIQLTTKSDFVIYLSVDIETIMQRIGDRNEEDCLGYEEEEKLRELKVRYERILEEEYQGRYITIDITSEDTVEDVLSMVMDCLDEFSILV